MQRSIKQIKQLSHAASAIRLPTSAVSCSTRRDRGVTITVTEPTVTLHREEPVFLSPSPSQRHALALSQPRCDAAVPSC